MGKPAVGRQKGQAAGGSHDLVGTRERSRGATTPTARKVVGQGRTTVGRQGAPCLRSRGRHRSLALAALPLPRALCSALEERQQAARRHRGRAKSLIESMRLRDWEPRRKLLLLVTLAYGFLLWVLAPCLLLARSRLLVHWEPRADWRQWNAKLPVYRLRWALSRLWLSHPPSFAGSGWRPYRPLSHLTWPPCSLRWWMTLWHQSGYLF